MSEPIVLPAGSTAWFVSDLHLWADRPRTRAAFEHTLDAAWQRGAALFILGDLFEYWAGDDDLDHPAVAPVIDALRRATARGVRIWFMRGNRDVLIGPGFAEATGVRLIADDRAIVALGAARALLMHGDTLCTDDLAYQRFRARAYDRRVRRVLLAMPLAWRHALIAWMRRKSESRKARAPTHIMDVNAQAVRAALDASPGVKWLIHGHTHRPATHPLDDGRHRVVLTDWELDAGASPPRAEIVEWTGAQPVRRPIA